MVASDEQDCIDLKKKMDRICLSWIVGWCCELDDDNGSDGIGFDRDDGMCF